MRPTALQMLTRWLCLAGVIACLASPLFAGEPRPDATIKNKSFDARVYLDDTVKADPTLAADCLAEGRKWMEKSAAEAVMRRSMAGPAPAAPAAASAPRRATIQCACRPSTK